MNRLRNAGLLVITVAITASGILVPGAASATITPVSRVKSDLSKVKKAEHAYAKTHRVAAKTFGLNAGDSVKVGERKITARKGEDIYVTLGHEGTKRGYCLVLAYKPLHGETANFAFYDSVLRRQVLNQRKGFPVGGACLSHAEQQKAVKRSMTTDIYNGIVAQSNYRTLYPDGGAGFAYVSDWRHPETTTLPKGVDLADPHQGNVVRAIVNPAKTAFCITVTNKVAKTKKHSYYYSSTTKKTRQGVYGDDKIGACAALRH